MLTKESGLNKICLKKYISKTAWPIQETPAIKFQSIEILYPVFKEVAIENQR